MSGPSTPPGPGSTPESSDFPPGFRSGFVALIGRPNVGKSTLLNRLVGSKIAIVSNKPQTTRTRIHGILNLDRAQIVLVDTPGIHRPLHTMNRRMMKTSLAALDDVDLIACVTDVGQPFGRGDEYLLSLLQGRQPSPILLLNKIDSLHSKKAILPVISRWSQKADFADVFPISARTGAGVDEALAGMAARMPPGPELFPPEQLSDVTDRFLAAEIVREKILMHTEDELPYTTTVLVEEYLEPDTAAGVIRIEASILVERDSQKGLIIGKGGALLKRIGTEARLELEHLLERRVFLGLVVKARGRWREDERLLDRLGVPR